MSHLSRTNIVCMYFNILILNCTQFQILCPNWMARQLQNVIYIIAIIIETYFQDHLAHNLLVLLIVSHIFTVWQSHVCSFLGLGPICLT